MREHWARGLAVLTGLIVVLFAVAFAAVQNPPGEPAAIATPPPATSAEATADPALLARGRAAFDARGCVRCHAIAGHGNPRSPLDGVGARIPRGELRDWVIGGDAARDQLAPRVLATKRDYAALPPDELDALLAYLASLKE